MVTTPGRLSTSWPTSGKCWPKSSRNRLGWAGVAPNLLRFWLSKLSRGLVDSADVGVRRGSVVELSVLEEDTRLKTPKNPERIRVKDIPQDWSCRFGLRDDAD